VDGWSQEVASRQFFYQISMKTCSFGAGSMGAKSDRNACKHVHDAKLPGVQEASTYLNRGYLSWSRAKC
jgi:hypothetical protein